MFVVLDLRNTDTFPNKDAAEAHIERVSKQWAGADDQHPRPDLVAVKVPKK